MVGNPGHIFRLLLINVLQLGCGMKKFASTYFTVSLEINDHHFLFTREQYLLRRNNFVRESSYQISNRVRKEASKNGRESQPIACSSLANPSVISDPQTSPERSPREDIYPLFKG